ncbi:MAG: aminodeoxychorismate/anthranilate synthase component II [Candidatus Gygaella obscura]|nr:aminodeoxychorismate/anthranilate synthase component II [Candidatus Gygaella obscura]
MILVIDNYDSFTYNLVQYIEEFNFSVKVYRNDKISLRRISGLNPKKIIISPGPGRPEKAGITCSCIKEFSEKIPILGVCLGHQAIAYAFGAKIIQAKRLMHGKTSLIYHNKKTIFKNIVNPFVATRYHSLIVEKKSLSKCFEIIAKTKVGEIMAIKHTEFPLWGVQFHPESILTKCGKSLLKNFLFSDR